jgi:hypothetical protein
MRTKTWCVLDYGPEGETRFYRSISFNCPHCGTEAALPVRGRVLATTSHGGIVFDNDDGLLPTTVQCRTCKHTFTTEAEPDEP